MKDCWLLFLCLAVSALSSCGGGEDPVPNIEVLSSTINGASINGPNMDVQVEADIVLVFSSAIDPELFPLALNVLGGSLSPDYVIMYANASSKVTISVTLEYNTDYTVSIAAVPIGVKGESLENPLTFDFKTAEDGIIRSMEPCTNVGDCLQEVNLTGSEGSGTFEFYANYPIYEEAAQWEELTHAVIVVHGASHNPADYYGWMNTTFASENLSASTILIAPYFRNTATSTTADFYWSNTNWRRGQPSSNSNKLSSFDAIDALIDQLSNKERFPVLEKVIVTGHSSGAAFTHVYAGATTSELDHPSLTFEYVVANSQFFYYPDDRRIDENTNQLYTPANCTAATFWPLGYNAIPAYLTGVSAETFNDRFVNRNVTYLLGNGTQSDPTFSSTNCENEVQGSSRYQRGENMFRYMELVYPGTHNHSKIIVNGVGHDGQGMYQSLEFKTLLSALLN